ncbi:hypothetical protein HYH02_008513 [Chlamydomonas schloesseri]|uniref:Tetratricopeptide repeat protein 5 OB fold domain-containing protein n=1 Tax=Chlamydomonas schloesseri TaxID=2026947 RepID=A0A836B3D7_9CHLO|nr:hypothetical protein HYH02_008513 [Chlamydomonas schloesseri]|eukprot:KAG2446526.1 hypothetical protein HYH02_008513 [Chlamydomonas schloesseri]
MPSSAASALMEKLRVELEDLIEQLSELAEAKRMYGSVRPAPGPHRAGHAPRRPDAGSEGRQAGGAAQGGEQRLGPEDEVALLKRADECSTRMLALLSDEPHAATRHQPLRGAALLAAGLVAFLRGGASDAAVSGLQAAVKLRPLNPTAWNCLAHSYWERGDLFMAGCCLTSGLRHCPSVAAHQMMSLLVRQQGGAAGAALLQPSQPPPPQQQQQQPPAPSHSAQAHDRSNSNASASTSAAGAGAGAGGGRANPSAGAASSAAGPAGSLGSTSSHGYSGGGAGTSGGGAGPSWSSAAAPPGAAATAAAALAASLAHARRALDMDIENGYSWYVLAMAQMAAYFKGEHAAGLWSGGAAGGAGAGAGAGARGGRGELHRVLAAFAQAERCGCADLPDLHYNRAALHAFTQDFAAALQDYATAARLDPAGLAGVAAAQSEALLVLLGQLAGLVAGRGGVRERHWAAVTSLLAADAARGAELLPRIHHERLALRTLRDLAPGSNRGVVLLCRPLVFVAPPLAASSSGTLYLVCVDTAGSVLALALSHIPHDAFDMTALLAVLHPELRHVHVTWPQPQQQATGAGAGAASQAQSQAQGEQATPPSPVQQHPQQQQPGKAAERPAEPQQQGDAATPAGAAPAPPSAPPATTTPPPPPPPSAPRTYSFPMLLVGCDPGCRSSVLVDGVPLHQAPATPLLRHVTRAA